ncbi:hypothetical protein [Cesiribacter sp. SM1]|uniref:hypothetical protein n=1 Tax=Cesiribacter sp. SM1 TaxID=2861196 RepID=UPI001CD1B9A6|nr:hypothetical protein [Cesiribacter sp. SM1]
MQILRNTALFLLVGVLTIGFAQAQTEVQQKVERYLFSNYNTNKAAIRENERTIRILEERYDNYLETLDMETKALVVAQDKEVKQYLAKVEKVRDVQLLTQMVEEAHAKHAVALDKFVNKGLNSTADALECRKIIVMRLAEHELITAKQDKLIALLKDDHTRHEFIMTLLKKGKVKESTDLKAFAKSIDLEVLGYGI